MSVSRWLFRLLLGERAPLVDGELRLVGIGEEVEIVRDEHGIPHVEAGSDVDAAFALGFCHGQDRAFQLEMLLRVGRGTLAEVVGRDGLPLDRVARRIGFRRGAEAQVAACDPGIRAWIEAYTRGVTAGAMRGSPRHAHEFALLRSRPTPWDPADVLGVGRVAAFLLASNWDAELTRALILSLDGPEALEALDIAPPDRVAGMADRTIPGAELTARLAEDLRRFADAVGANGGSNNWVLNGRRTASGRPLLANDPHLAPTLPPHWYLAHVRTPAWEVAGATFVGTPAFVVAHNGHGAWGVTSALVDDTDLFLEELDGDRVRDGDRFVPCERREETIHVRRHRTVREVVLETPNGPIVGPALGGVEEATGYAISIRATWLEPLPIEGFLRAHRARSFREFRGLFERWPATSFNVVWADASGTIGWQLAATVPRRRKGFGTLPGAGWEESSRWEETHVAFEDLPHAVDPPSGFLATANAEPASPGAFLGVDFLEDYRAARVREALLERDDWDVVSSQRLQLDLTSLPWREIREPVLAAPVRGEDAERGHHLLATWDGNVDPRSPAAAVYELLVRELIQRAVRAKAPRAAAWAEGEGFTLLTPSNLFGARWAGRLTRLVRQQPDGWFALGWPREIGDALGAAVGRLRGLAGDDQSRWAWGRVRPLVLPHVVGERSLLARVYNRGPIPIGGDANTLAQAAVPPDDPLAPPVAIASLRAVIDVGEWGISRFSLPGGQSGNPCSPHYDDLLPLWAVGSGVPIAWTDEEIRMSTRATLLLVPGAH